MFAIRIQIGSGGRAFCCTFVHSLCMFYAGHVDFSSSYNLLKRDQGLGCSYWQSRGIYVRSTPYVCCTLNCEHIVTYIRGALVVILNAPFILFASCWACANYSVDASAIRSWPDERGINSFTDQSKWIVGRTADYAVWDPLPCCTLEEASWFATPHLTKAGLVKIIQA